MSCKSVRTLKKKDHHMEPKQFFPETRVDTPNAKQICPTARPQTLKEYFLYLFSKYKINKISGSANL